MRWKMFERTVQPSSKRWIIIRDRDGMVWAGPYRWQGNTFTKAEKFWYQFANVESAQSAIVGSGFVGVTLKRIA